MAPDQDDLVASASPSAPTSPNPFAQAASVYISVPESVEIRLVDATALSEYEVWSLMTSVLWSAVLGFGVAFAQSEPAKAPPFFWITVVLAFLMLITGIRAFIHRRRLWSAQRKVSFRLGEPVESPMSSTPLSTSKPSSR
jgi:hypothetical protein